jgi:hypothetical protein
MSITQLSPGSRVWFFIANRPLNSEEAAQLTGVMSEFVSGWKSHGSALSADFDFRWNALLTVAVDESVEAPSGCSIDKVFRLLNDFMTATGIDFLTDYCYWCLQGKIPQIFIPNPLPKKPWKKEP